MKKTFIITGATKGMGLAISTKMLEKGHNIVMIYKNDETNANKVNALLKDFKKQFLLLKLDITIKKNRKEIIKKTLQKFKKIDVLVNNAGMASKHNFLKVDEKEFDKIININLKAPIFLAKMVAEHMLKQSIEGTIINIASVSGHRGMGGISYDAAKAGLILATQTMANKLGKYNIRVNSISPGTHKTEMNRHGWENESPLFKKMINVTALMRAAEASEIVGTVEFLSSSQSSYVTGTDIIVDGGYLSHCPGRN